MKVPCLGFEIDHENNSIRMTHGKVKAITDWPDPESPHNMRSFVDLTEVYRCFVLHFAPISARLLDLVTIN
jgi:hypothetical protein